MFSLAFFLECSVVMGLGVLKEKKQSDLGSIQEFLSFSQMEACAALF